MAIKVSGTSVINDSRQLQNVASLDATTTNTIAAAIPSGGSTVELVASGTLSNGTTVCLNSNGTVSAVSGSETNQVFNQSSSYDYPADQQFASIYEPNQNKVVAFSRNTGSYGMRAYVGTVSGNTISFGSAQTTSNTRCEEIGLCYDDYANKIIAVYRGASPYYGYARAISVSGSSLNFGTEYAFNTSESTVSLSVGFDAGQNKSIVDYGKAFTSTRCKVITGNPSNHSLSFGSETQISSSYPGSARGRRFSYDTSINRLVHVAATNSSNIEARICTISGTSPSFSSPTIITGPNRSPAQSSGSTNLTDIQYDPDNECHMVLVTSSALGRAGSSLQPLTTSSTSAFAALVNPLLFTTNSDTGQARISYDTAADSIIAVGNKIDADAASDVLQYVKIEYDGTNFTLQPAVNFGGLKASGNVMNSFDTNSSKVAINYVSGNNAYGICLQTPYADSNLSNDNFLGFSDAAYSNGQTATVEVNGNISDNQSGLTGAQKYYVQSNGTLSLTPNDFTPEAYAGLALTSSKILIKG